MIHDKFEFGPTIDMMKMTVEEATMLIGEFVYQALRDVGALSPLDRISCAVRVVSVDRQRREVRVQWEDRTE